jgi:hypothetical protein
MIRDHKHEKFTEIYGYNVRSNNYSRIKMSDSVLGWKKAILFKHILKI